MSNVLAAAHIAPKCSEDSSMTLDKADARTFHNTDAAYVLPNEYVQPVICLGYEHNRTLISKRYLLTGVVTSNIKGWSCRADFCIG
jgi:hypothetical protein